MYNGIVQIISENEISLRQHTQPVAPNTFVSVVKRHLNVRSVGVQSNFAFNQKSIDPMTMGISIKVFVYGTLKSGQPNHFWITDSSNGSAQLQSAGTTSEKYPMVIATRYNIPFLLDLPGTGHPITGEIYAVDDNKLKQLDIVENYPKFYDRILVDVATPNG